MGKVRKEEIRLLFFPINKNYLEVYGKNDFYVGMDLKEYGYNYTILHIHSYSIEKHLIIVKYETN